MIPIILSRNCDRETDRLVRLYHAGESKGPQGTFRGRPALIQNRVFTDEGPGGALGGQHAPESGSSAVVHIPPTTPTRTLRAILTWVQLQYPTATQLYLIVAGRKIAPVAARLRRAKIPFETNQ